MLLRPAQPSDALAIARVHVRAWQHGYAGILPASYLNQLRPEDRAEKYDLSHADPSHPHTIVATDADIISPTETSSLGNIARHSSDPAGNPTSQSANSANLATTSLDKIARHSADSTGQSASGLIQDKILGFATTRPSQESDLPHHGELTALYVDPDSWGRGIGVALVSAARAHLVSLSLRHAYLFTLVDNLRAQHFYKSDQWAPDGLTRTDTVWGAAVHVLRFQRNL
jgi:ribosomal protein S18 acetylase RimI-like enzyme